VKYYALVGEREKKQSLLPWREKVRMRGGYIIKSGSTPIRGTKDLVEYYGHAALRLAMTCGETFLYFSFQKNPIFLRIIKNPCSLSN